MILQFVKKSIALSSSLERLPRRRGRIHFKCDGVGGVQGALTLFSGGVAQTCHDDRVVELKEQLVVEEIDREGQEGKGRRERSSQRERAMDDMEMTM